MSTEPRASGDDIEVLPKLPPCILEVGIRVQVGAVRSTKVCIPMCSQRRSRVVKAVVWGKSDSWWGGGSLWEGAEDAWSRDQVALSDEEVDLKAPCPAPYFDMGEDLASDCGIACYCSVVVCK